MTRYSKYAAPNPVNELAKAAAHGRLSRREIIKRGSALGLSSALMANILKLESTGAQGTPAGGQPVGYSIVVPDEFQQMDLSGQRFTYVGGAEGSGTPLDQALVDAFVEATGAEVNFVRGAESATDRLSFYLQVFGAQASDIDICMIDVIWPGILNPHAIDLNQALQEQNANYFDRIVQNNTVNDKLVGIPWYTDAGLLYYRTDLLEKYGASEPPQTWTELQEMAQTIQEGEASANPSFVGFVWQGAAYEGLTCNALEWQYSNGGGTIIEPTGEVTVNNEQAISMFEMAKGWVGTISPTAVTDFQEEDARGIWQGGNAAFMRNWPYAYALSAAEDSVISGQFDVGQLPMGDAEGAQRAATLGGWQMMVSQYSQNQEVATTFARYMTSTNIQRTRAIEGAYLPTIDDLYTDPDVLAVNPFFERLLPVFQGGAVARPSTISADFYNDVSTAYFTAVNQILTGSASDPASRVEELAGALEDIMSEL